MLKASARRLCIYYKDSNQRGNYVLKNICRFGIYRLCKNKARTMDGAGLNRPFTDSRNQTGVLLQRETKKSQQ